MAKNVILQPPEIVKLDSEDKVIFLAGPIQGAPDWQATAAAMIHDADSSIVIASPRKEYAEGDFVYEKQVDWETHYLARAAQNGVILFWLATQTVETPGRSYAQTTRFELGEWKSKHEAGEAKMTVGIEEQFGNKRYISRRFAQDCPEVPILSSLQATCASAVKLAQNDN